MPLLDCGKSPSLPACSSGEPTWPQTSSLERALAGEELRGHLLSWSPMHRLGHRRVIGHRQLYGSRLARSWSRRLPVNTDIASAGRGGRTCCLTMRLLRAANSLVLSFMAMANPVGSSGGCAMPTRRRSSAPPAARLPRKDQRMPKAWATYPRSGGPSKKATNENCASAAVRRRSAVGALRGCRHGQRKYRAGAHAHQREAGQREPG